MKNKNIFFGVVLLIIIVLVISIKVSSAQQTTQTSLDSSDAIGVRIVPNPEHYSIARWYKNQGFSGSPQSLTVDGYEAIRDGRTVYVNAANIKIDPDNQSNRLIYTNIYLISYNQNPSAKTVDILGQIIKNWKFNADLPEDVSASATCAISTDVCASDADCSSNQFCAPASSAQANTCQLKETKNCFFDADCPKGFFCDSVKAKVIRDVKRAGQAVEITEALNRYQSAFGIYPQLSAGSYLSGQTLSLWPSWSANFLKELSLPANFIDPINRLGYCPGFDKTTCWSASSSRFYVPSGTTAGTSLVLPANSYAYAYRLNEGKTFSFCSTLETAVNKTGLNFQFSPPAVAGSCIVDGLPNTPPRFVSAQLEGEPGKEFIGWVEFVDDQDNLMTWKMSLIGNNWKKSLPFGITERTWKTEPILQNTNNSNQKKVYAPQAPDPGKYQIRLDVSDGQTTTTTKFLDIVISSAKPFIEAENMEYKLTPNRPFVYGFYFSDDNLNNYQTAYKIAKINSTHLSFDPLLSSSPDLKKTIEKAGLNRYKVLYEYNIPTTFKFNKNEEYNYKITVTNKYGDASSKDFKININNDIPSLEFNCFPEARIGKNYSCLLGPKKQLGAGNQSLNYTFSSNFTNLMIDDGADRDYVILKSDYIRSSGSTASGAIRITATNEYGGSSERSFNLQLNNYCGDGSKQMPNDEKRGGIYNDGYEDCDGVDGVSAGTNRVASSSISKQYACATFDANTPYPIPSSGYCVYKSPVSGGGFCGDGYCQVKDEQGNNLENYENCSRDCLHLCQPNCANKSCGDDGCGGSCGSCGIVGEDCYGGSCCSNQGTVSVFLFDDQVIIGGIEGEPAIFFNNKRYQLSPSSQGTYSVKVPVEHGKNVLAVDAQIKNAGSGVNVSLSHCSRQPISPDNIKNVKCVNPVASIKDVWYRKDYNDTTWPQANFGYYQGRASVWANDYDSSHSRLINAYCRYTFNGDDTSLVSCKPDWSSQECGTNPCGSNYRPNDCIETKGSDAFSCHNNVCGCEKRTCAYYGETSRKEGSVCGLLSDGCGGTIDCGYNPVDPGLYCLMSYESKPDDPSLLYYKQWDKEEDYDFLKRGCHIGGKVNTYQKKCWYTSYKRAVTMRQGDIPDVTECSVTKVDNPRCFDNPDPTCPTQCSTKTLTSSGLDKDSCWTQNMFSSFFGFWETWTPRKEWRCSTETTKKTWYYGDICFTDTGDKVLSKGTCGSCQPNCSDKQCGAADGCGGVCQTGFCAENQRCSNGACITCDCETTLCGEKNACGFVCSSGGVCPPNFLCKESFCKSVKPGYCVGISDVIGDCSLIVATNSDECTSFSGCTWTENCEPNCAGKNCGANGCGGSCGDCPSGQYCQSGNCTSNCTPNCTGKKICGSSDGCGGKCLGLCIKGYMCVDGSCELTPVPTDRQVLGLCIGSSPSCSTNIRSNCLQKNGCTWVDSIER